MQWGPAADAKVSVRRRATTQTSHSRRGISLLIFCQLFMHTLRIHAVKLDYQALAQALGDGTSPRCSQKIHSVAVSYFEAHFAHILHIPNIANVPSVIPLRISWHMYPIRHIWPHSVQRPRYTTTFICFPCHSAISSNTMQFIQTSPPKQSSTVSPNSKKWPKPNNLISHFPCQALVAVHPKTIHQAIRPPRMPALASAQAMDANVLLLHRPRRPTARMSQTAHPASEPPSR